MIIDIRPYNKYKETLFERYKTEGLKKAKEVANYSYMPLIATLEFLNDEFGGLEEDIEKVKEFYGYTEVLK